MKNSRPGRDKVLPWVVCTVAVIGLLIWIVTLFGKLIQ